VSFQSFAEGVEIDARFAWLCSVSGNPRCAPAHWLSSLRGVAIGASIGGNLFSKLSQSFVTGADVPGTADVPSPWLIGATGTVESEAFCVNDWPLIAGVIVPPRSPSVADGVVIVASFAIPPISSSPFLFP
jgi:hypothetical protein